MYIYTIIPHCDFIYECLANWFVNMISLFILYYIDNDNFFTLFEGLQL